MVVPVIKQFFVKIEAIHIVFARRFINEVSTSDILSIRKNSEAFGTWRSSLATALDYASRSRNSGIESAKIQKGVEELLSSSLFALKTEARKTRLLSKQGLVSFVVGAISGIGGNIIGGPVGAIAAGGAVGLLASLVQSALGIQTVPEYLNRHFIAFTEPID